MSARHPSPNSLIKLPPFSAHLIFKCDPRHHPGRFPLRITSPPPSPSKHFFLHSNDLRKEVGLPLLSIPKEFRRIKTVEASTQFAKFSEAFRKRRSDSNIALTINLPTCSRKNTDAFFAYDANYLIDNKAGIIVDAEATRANRIAEIAITETMIERVKDRFDLHPLRLAGDTAYGAVRLLKWLVNRKIAPHIPVWDKSVRTDGTFSRAEFVFDRSRNVYICPKGKLLHTTGTVIEGSTLRYRASKRDCDVCAFKMQCCPHTPSRWIPRDIHEDARDVARILAKTEAFEQSRRERKKVEMCFAHMKRIFKLDRLRLRGLSGARDEVLLTATAQNLRRLVKFFCRPPPSAAVPCAA